MNADRDLKPSNRQPLRADERWDQDVGGGFVEPHWRGDGVDWNESYPYKGTELIEDMAVKR